MALCPSRIPGPAIAGLEDLFVGAQPPPKKPTIVVRTPPAARPAPGGGKVAPPPAKHDLKWAKSPQQGRTYITQVPTKGKTNEDSIAKAKQIAQRAAQVAASVSQAAKAAGKKTLVGATSAKQAAGAHLHAVRLAQAAKDVADRAKKLGTSADRHQSTVTTGKAKQKQAVAIQKTVYGPSGKPGVPVHVGGESAPAGVVLDAYYTVVGAWPDPDRPGFLDDGSLDPIILIGEDGTLPPADPPADPNAPPADPNAPPADPNAADAALNPADPTYGLGPPPTSAPPFVAGQDFMPGASYPLDAVLSFPPTDPTDPRSGLPAGAVLYDPKSKPWGWQSVGSYTRFVSSDDKSDGHGPSGFQWGGGNRGILDGWYWYFFGSTAGTEYKHENAGNSLREAGNYGSGAESMKHRAEVSSQLGWGPLIGNPSDPNFKGLRYDTAGDRWFWFYDEAPAWAKSVDPIVGDGVRLQKAILDYQTQLTAAKADALQAAAQDKLDQKDAAELARQQAKQDAAAAAQQHQLETQAQQQQTQQQQAEAAAASQAKIAQTQQETQANALVLQQTQQQLAQQSQAEGGGGGYDDGDGGGYDDGGGSDDGGGQDDDSPRMDTSEYVDD